MVNQDQIKRLATKLQTTELNVRREYFQHLFLNYFYRLTSSEEILFKGGTALRILHSSPRFSEDLDFDALIHEVRLVENLLEESMVEMEREGVSVDLQEGKGTTGGYLGVLRFQAMGQVVDIKIEVSFRKARLNPEIFTVKNDYIPSYQVVALDTEQMVASKIKALLNRQKARDFYDLYFILRNLPRSITDKSVIKRVLKLMQKSEVDFERDLELLLPKSHGLVVKHFKESMIKELERWI